MESNQQFTAILNNTSNEKKQQLQSNIKAVAMNIISSNQNSPKLDKDISNKFNQSFAFQNNQMSPPNTNNLNTVDDYNFEKSFITGGNIHQPSRHHASFKFNQGSMNSPEQQSPYTFTGSKPIHKHSNSNDLYQMQTHHLRQLGGSGDVTQSQRLELTSSSGNNPMNLATSRYQAQKENAHQIKHHGAALLKNHIGVISTKLPTMVPPMVEKQYAQASINGGIAIPLTQVGSPQQYSSKKYMLEQNSQSLNNSPKQQSILNSIQPVVVSDKHQQQQQGSSPLSNLNSTRVVEINKPFAQKQNLDRSMVMTKEVDDFLRDDFMSLQEGKRF